MCITRLPAAARRRQAGFSLVEVIMAMIIVGVGVVALLVPITSITHSSADPMVTKQMIAIAEGMLEEIELKPSAGTLLPPYTCATRAQFDAVTDYNNFSPPSICDIDGNPIAVLAGYSLTVTVVPTALGAIAAANANLITVTVTGPNGTKVALSAFRTSYF